ncbi:ArsR/SmtB family transcription factor [Phaeovulum vinaykumarii]|uniref:Transcriptional regulator, ArsR family n=1 Tax=Phaeovulum vinaykumarii TaxID=407234 RepID=A0A1N7KUN8_9RHOB|nr:metalloregulator ArsR/SmtB family transcription factor [Phaeovulum vinaykumarii]SIS65313.1 transcriptional regulator, ArsR family [Phaeovulum vinaykumarii]SOC01326.1 ArsR family transcriptional regulator [Phaeovulum vinaykumarii]
MVQTVLAALAEPTRLQAMALLADGSEHCVCELMRKLGATQSRMSRHMQVLRQAGLVTDRRDAQWVRYRLNPEMPPEIAAILSAVLAAAAASHERTAA